jgi:hypothetical protein
MNRWLLVAAVLLGACGREDDAPGETFGWVEEAIHSGHSGPPPWPHVLTCYGGCDAPHYDASACNHHTSCGPVANGHWWYATERAAFGCGAKLKLQRGDKCVVVDVEDNGPADWVESNAASRCGTGYIIDASPLVADYFGGGCGWGECFVVQVTPVSADTPTGPAGCQQCHPGDQQSEGCGNCGHRTRTCDGGGHWGGWSGCDGQGPCSPGQVDRRGCCDCGTQARTCGGNCQWGDFGACGGPDPDGGNRGCDTGQCGPCADGRVRCVNGCFACAAVTAPMAELCDGVDNDCNCDVDDGFPSQIGATPPPFAARLDDVSYPQSLAAGEKAEAWARFVNVGTQTWPAGEIWLGSGDAEESQLSPLYDADGWAAWDVPAVLDEDVPPGGVAQIAFPVIASGTRPAQDRLWLLDPSSQRMRCPLPIADVSIDVRAAPPSAPVAPPSAALHDEARAATASGCAAVDPTASPMAALWLLALATRRRAGPRRARRAWDGAGARRSTSAARPPRT